MAGRPRKTEDIKENCSISSQLNKLDGNHPNRRLELGYCIWKVWVVVHKLSPAMKFCSRRGWYDLDSKSSSSSSSPANNNKWHTTQHRSRAGKVGVLGLNCEEQGNVSTLCLNAP
ncbi:hypothetical protein P5673_016737 [Acropora cervicornis]|uniref:Uncharacterized protein n=1 Tax=Acropora cervicornis TaxID=6130 RepID=A0AAD9QFI9_ACRCE|nr:hypothetical protein P5673_016737 [Acropora cervicornis]